jgi:hypothetical protein
VRKVHDFTEGIGVPEYQRYVLAAHRRADLFGFQVVKAWKRDAELS